jgi:hypothetical protein
MKRQDLTGRVFERLTVIRQAPNQGFHRAWYCTCVCSPDLERAVRSDALLNGDARSCGCLLVDMNKDAALHGHTIGGCPSPTYISWRAMLARCNDPRADGYAAYGGQGVSVCERWLVFASFLADMGERPIGKTLDRFPNRNGNYEPGNVRWATPHEQTTNRDATKLTDEIAQEIRDQHERGDGVVAIAKQRGLDRGHVHSILSGRIWKSESGDVLKRRTVKLTMDIVQEIHGRHEHGENVNSIVKRMAISESHVRRVLNGEIWKEAIDGYPPNWTPSPQEISNG